MRLKVLLVVIVCVLLTACGIDATEAPLGPAPTEKPAPTATEKPSPTATETQSAYDISAEALAYLDTALDFMQEHSINREQINWDALRTRTYRRAFGAQTTADTYRAIQYALGDLGDNHSYLMTPEQVAQMEDGTMVAAISGPSGRLLEGRLGYVYLPSWAGTHEAADEHATAIQDIIRDLDAQDPCGWIVDLRENLGGAMWPMLAGIGPILGEGLAGSVVAPDGSMIHCYYINGQAIYGDEVQTEIKGAAYTLSEPLPPVAVLTGLSTSSSGEAIVIAFRGRPDTRSFGKATSGLSTATREIELSDGAWLILAVSTFTDRTGQVYGSKIAPDEIVNQPKGQDDPTLQAAVDWLLGQSACATSK